MGETPTNGDSGATREARNLTRRGLLAGAAAAGAASLIRPAAGLAGAPDGARAVSSRWIGALTGTSPVIAAPTTFALAGLQWVAPRDAMIELRARTLARGWTPWAPASALGHDPDRRSTGRGLFGEPLWTGAADAIQVRSGRRVEGLRVHFVAPEPLTARAASLGRLAAPTLDAGPGQPPILARQAWGGSQARPAHSPTYGTVDLAFVHHTVNPNGYSPGEVPGILLGIFYYHVQVRGFWDIAYNFIIDLYGRIWEGRAGGIDMAVIGAHAGAYNAQSTGVAVLGDFMNVAPSQAAIAALERLLAWKLSLHGVPAQGRATVVVDPASAYYTPFRPGAHVSLPRIAGHRDGDATDCPGNALYGQLSSIRPRVASLAGTPARVTLAPPASVPTAGTPATISGRLEQLTGQPLAGAPVELQQLRLAGLSAKSVAIATATTAADGSWSAPANLQVESMLRAVHRQHPAGVSDWVPVPVAPAIALTLMASSPPQLAGTISPSKRQVTVALYPAAGATGKPLATKKVQVVRGRFSVGFAPQPPGDYVVVARSVADDVNAAGRSAPVPFTAS